MAQIVRRAIYNYLTQSAPRNLRKLKYQIAADGSPTLECPDATLDLMDESEARLVASRLDEITRCALPQGKRGRISCASATACAVCYVASALS